MFYYDTPFEVSKSSYPTLASRDVHWSWFIHLGLRLTWTGHLRMASPEATNERRLHDSYGNTKSNWNYVGWQPSPHFGCVAHRLPL